MQLLHCTRPTQLLHNVQFILDPPDRVLTFLAAERLFCFVDEKHLQQLRVDIFATGFVCAAAVSALYNQCCHLCNFMASSGHFSYFVYLLFICEIRYFTYNL